MEVIWLRSAQKLTDDVEVTPGMVRSIKTTPNPQSKTTNAVSQSEHHSSNKDFERGFEQPRAIEFVKKEWQFSSSTTPVTYNGKGWDSSREVPQESIIAFVPR
jgi:hypothetical protein